MVGLFCEVNFFVKIILLSLSLVRLIKIYKSTNVYFCKEKKERAVHLVRFVIHRYNYKLKLVV